MSGGVVSQEKELQVLRLCSKKERCAFQEMKERLECGQYSDYTTAIF